MKVKDYVVNKFLFSFIVDCNIVTLYPVGVAYETVCSYVNPPFFTGFLLKKVFKVRISQQTKLFSTIIRFLEKLTRFFETSIYFGGTFLSHNPARTWIYRIPLCRQKSVRIWPEK